MLTYWELKEQLKRVPEVDLLELLEISSEDIVERFQDLIEERYEQLEKELQD